MSLIDRTILEWAWMSEKGYPDLNNENDLKVFESMFGFNLKEAQTGKATLFESALVQAWYTVNKKEIPEGAIDPKEFAKLKSNPEMVKKAEEAIKSLNLQGGNSAQGTGRGISASLTSFWSGFGATNTTPKTDVILGDKRISVKVGSSQLMSGGKEESLATFFAAMKNTPDLLNSSEAKTVISTFEKFVKKGITKSGGVEQNLKNNTDKIISDGDKAHKEMKANLEQLFNKSKDLRIAFAHEAMSGYKKFGAESSASADFVLTTDKSFSNATLNSVNDKSYAAKIAEKMNLTVRFKSTQTTKAALKSPENPKGGTGMYRFWSVVALIVNPSRLSEENIIEENIISSVVDNIKNIFSKGIDKIVKFLTPSSQEIDIDFKDEIEF